MSDFFKSDSNSDESMAEPCYVQDSPLASRMRPRNLNEYLGQQHILGEGKLLLQ